MSRKGGRGKQRRRDAKKTGWKEKVLHIKRGKTERKRPIKKGRGNKVCEREKTLRDRRKKGEKEKRRRINTWVKEQTNKNQPTNQQTLPAPWAVVQSHRDAPWRKNAPCHLTSWSRDITRLSCQQPRWRTLRLWRRWAVYWAESLRGFITGTRRWRRSSWGMSFTPGCLRTTSAPCTTKWGAF